MKSLAAFCIILYFVGLVLEAGIYHTLNEDKHPARIEACRTAGGDGRYELRGDPRRDLWCAHADGTLFPVLDPPKPKPEGNR